MIYKKRFEQLNDGFIYDNEVNEYVTSPCVNLKYQMKSLTDLLNQKDLCIKELKTQVKELESIKIKEIVDTLEKKFKIKK